MSEKRYFKYNPIDGSFAGTFVAFPAKICVFNSFNKKTITQQDDYTVELFEEDENFDECTETEFLQVYALVNNHLSNQFLKQF